jgi:hypothetical protein
LLLPLPSIPSILADRFVSILFISRRKKNAPPEDSIFQCIGMLSSAFGPILTKHMHDLLDLMFAGGLTDSLRGCLVTAANEIKPLQKTIQGASSFFHRARPGGARLVVRLKLVDMPLFV